MFKAAAPATLGSKEIPCLQKYGKEFRFSEGSLILRRGHQARSLFVITSGEVELCFFSDDGAKVGISRLGKGNFFGETSLTGDRSVATDVVASSAVTLLVISTERLTIALEECDELRAGFIAGLAGNSSSAGSFALNQFQKSQFYSRLSAGGGERGSLIARSPAMKMVVRQLEILAGSRLPVLIHGESGTGKTLAAGEIHRASPESDKPFIVVDCRNFSCEEIQNLLFGTQEELCYGHAASSSERCLEIGAVHHAMGGTVVLKNIEAMTYAAQENLAGHVETLREKGGSPSTRFIFTSCKPLDSHAAEPYLHHFLASLVAERTLRMPSLRERRKDVIPLANFFLEKCGGKHSFYFSVSAKRKLVSRSYAFENIIELEEVVESSTFFTDGAEIRSEHIMAGLRAEQNESELNLGSLPIVRYLTGQSFVRGAEIAMAAAFAVVVVLSLARSGEAAGFVANTVVWGLWEPAVFASFFFAGRLWCTTCPVSGLSRAASFLGRARRPPPLWIKQHSHWYMIGGFLAIVWAEQTFDMLHHPLAGGLLLATILLLAAAATIVYEKETWCRYLCPLGGFGALYSNAAPLRVKTNAHICTSYCTTHDCYKGSSRRQGCPVFHHPLYERDSGFCKFCFQCQETCPHDSANLYMRAPVQSIWTLPELGSGLTLFALFIFFFAPVMLASQGDAWAATPAGLATGGTLAAGLAVAFQWFLLRFFPKEERSDPSLVNRIALSLAILAWGPAMAYQLERIPGLSSLHVEPHAGSFLQHHLPVAEVSSLVLFQFSFILLAGVVTGVALLGIGMRIKKTGGPSFHAGWRALLLICLLYQAAAILMLVPRGFFF